MTVYLLQASAGAQADLDNPPESARRQHPTSVTPSKIPPVEIRFSGGNQ